MNTDTTQSKVDANCKAIRQLRWLQKEYWDSYQFEINKLVAENEDLLNTDRNVGAGREAKVEAKANG